jgi:hypothetical protein
MRAIYVMARASTDLCKVALKCHEDIRRVDHTDLDLSIARDGK